jgi:hypothetical protein
MILSRGADTPDLAGTSGPGTGGSRKRVAGFGSEAGGYPRDRGKGFPWIDASRISMGWAAWTDAPFSRSTRWT